MRQQLNAVHKFLFIIVWLFFFACNHSVTIHPQKKNIVETVYASGKIIANNEYNLFALSSGTVIKKLVKEGDTVTVGQILYIINYNASAAKLDAARSNFSNAQSNLSAQSPIFNDLKLSMQTAET